MSKFLEVNWRDNAITNTIKEVLHIFRNQQRLSRDQRQQRPRILVLDRQCCRIRLSQRRRLALLWQRNPARLYSPYCGTHHGPALASLSQTVPPVQNRAFFPSRLETLPPSQEQIHDNTARSNLN